MQNIASLACPALWNLLPDVELRHSTTGITEKCPLPGILSSFSILRQKLKLTLTLIDYNITEADSVSNIWELRQEISFTRTR